MNRTTATLLALLAIGCTRKEAPTAVVAASHPETASSASPAAPVPTLAPDARRQMATEHAVAAAGPADVGPIRVEKAEGPDGRNVAELFARKAELRGRQVAVRGKVVKVLHGIMGKTWIHLRDGSGTRANKDDDLTITTADDAAVGEVVLVRGELSVDVDLGAGYVYPVLIEGAKVSRGPGP
jgi:hypothetical protein